MKKKLLTSFSPAYLVQGPRWFICFYASTEEREEPTRYRVTFNLNRIKDKRLRKKRGEELVSKINWWLGKGFRAWNFEERKVPHDYDTPEEEKRRNILGETNIIEALEFIRDVKSRTGAKDTARTYRSQSNLLMEFIKKKKYHKITIADFGKNLAMQYMDNRLTVDNVSHTTYNNTITNMRVIFNALLAREYIEANPFTDVAKKKPSEKKRRPFSDDEAGIVMARIKKECTLLFYALIFEYTCFIRPSEIRALRFKDVHLKSGVVTIQEHTKTKRTRFATIPDDFIQYFDKSFFKKYPQHYYIFGHKLEPHPTKQCATGSLYRKHKKILLELKSTGVLEDITGLTFYSWKDTGITYGLEVMKLLVIQDQAGHSTPQMTLKYREKPRVNREIKTGFKNKLLN